MFPDSMLLIKVHTLRLTDGVLCVNTQERFDIMRKIIFLLSVFHSYHEQKHGP